MTLEEKIKNLPAQPGVYLMKNAKGRVIYVGKAKSLKNRVRSYFQAGGDPDIRKAAMVEQIDDFETVITASEVDAFILESTLIKKHKPKYNIVLRDDKNYPYLKLSITETFPTLSVVRKIVKDGSLYFGPFVPSGPMWETLKFINRTFPLRKCVKKDVGLKPARPCLQFEMKRCTGPCSGNVSRDDYREMVDEIRLFLSGKDKDLIHELERRMKQASDLMNFEAAASFRDRLFAVKKATQSQTVISPGMEDRDLIAVAKEGAAADIQLIFVRKGKVIGRKDFYLVDALESPEDVLLSSFINQFYTDDKDIPPEVLVSHPLPDGETLEHLLSDMRGSSVDIRVPQRGWGVRVMEMARENAKVSLAQNLATASGKELTLISLKSELGLKRLPRTIECFDISNFSGKEAVASMVSFEDCKPRKDGYRHFKMKTEGPNDFAMMEEVVYRRYRRLLDEGGELPDLIMVDGGKGQLSAAIEALKAVGVDMGEVEIIGLAKAREGGTRFGGVREDRAFERVFRPGESDAHMLLPTSAAVNLLAAVRDESHRFAITYHRKLREKKGIASPLDNIPGIGKKRKMQLLKHFGSFRAIREAELVDLEAVPGLPKKVAGEIYGAVRGK